MKKLLLIILVVCSLNVFSQAWYCTINFENDPCSITTYYSIDTSHNGSIWQICTPHKLVFDSAYSKPKAILTDSSGPYPINDTSSFTIKVYWSSVFMNAVCIGGMYKMDSDSLKDFGLIEISVDNGVTWYNFLKDTTVLNPQWFTPKPVFTGRIHNWTYFFAMMNHLPPGYTDPDTLIYRFTFISDSVQTNKDGWMLDNIISLEHTEGIQNNQIQTGLTIYPNPTTDNLTIDVSATLNIPAIIEITNIEGQVIEQLTTNVETTNINVSALAKGMYFVKVKTEKGVAVKKFIKE